MSTSLQSRLTRGILYGVFGVWLLAGIALVLAFGQTLTSGIVLLLTVIGVVGIGMITAIVSVMVNRELATLGEAAKRMQGIGEQNLEQRVEAQDMPSEVRVYVDQVNSLLDRLEAAFERERGFIADAAHELRTPLTALRASNELALMGQRSSDELREMVRRNAKVVDGLAQLVEKLLLLAKLDHQAATAVGTDPVPLRDLIESTWEEAHLAEGKGSPTTWRNRIDPQAGFLADADLLCIVVSNLLRNAAHHVDDGGRVEVAVELVGDSDVRLRCSNTGCVLKPEMVDHLFDRFWQADTNRSETGRHAGLGLSIAQRAADRLGGKLTAEIQSGGWIHFYLTMSRAVVHVVTNGRSHARPTHRNEES